jgi:hypothetical protein
MNREWTLEDVVRATGAMPHGGRPAAGEIRGATLDSRQAAAVAGRVFVPLPGTRTDGHHHVAAALMGGAIAAFCAGDRATGVVAACGAAGVDPAGRLLVVPDPAAALSTWAYARLAANSKLAAARGGAGTEPMVYIPTLTAEARLAAWLADPASPAEALLLNNMERSVFAKYIALPALLAELQLEFGVSARMSGSGSACFALLAEEMAADPIIAAIRSAWGSSAFVVEARLA